MAIEIFGEGSDWERQGKKEGEQEVLVMTAEYIKIRQLKSRRS